MTKQVHHPRPCMPLASDSTVVKVDLTAFGMPGCIERLAVAHSSGGDFVVACLPFFTYGIQFGDLIAVRKPEMVFDRVIKPRGLRALRLAFNDKKLGDQHHEEIHGRLIGRGLSHEWHGSGYLAVLLRGLADQHSAFACVDAEIGENLISWEIDPEAFVGES